MSYDIEMLWTCSICEHSANRGLKDRYCGHCGHKKDASDPERMPDDTSEAAALTGKAAELAGAGNDWVCKYCESLQNQLNKCCGNCGAVKDGAARPQVEPAAPPRAPHVPRRTTPSPTPPPVWETETLAPAPRVWQRYALGALATGLLIWLGLWLFTPYVVQTKVSQVYWQHDTIIDRYAVHRHEGWTPSFDAIEVIPIGMRHHHYDRVHVGSHQEPYSDSYACGSYPTTRSCTSNGNGTARCSNVGGGTKYCTRTLYRTVQDYRDVSREQMWFMWKAWDWAYHRTVTRSGFSHATTWPAESELSAWIADGEKERSNRVASYKVTFADPDGETYVIRPTAQEFETYEIGDKRSLKVTRAGSVAVLP